MVRQNKSYKIRLVFPYIKTHDFPKSVTNARPCGVRDSSLRRRSVAEVSTRISSYGVPRCRLSERAPTIRDTVESGICVRVERSESDNPSFDAISIKHTMYCNGNSLSMFCHTRSMERHRFSVSVFCNWCIRSSPFR